MMATNNSVVLMVKKEKPNNVTFLLRSDSDDKIDLVSPKPTSAPSSPPSETTSPTIPAVVAHRPYELKKTLSFGKLNLSCYAKDHNDVESGSQSGLLFINKSSKLNSGRSNSLCM
jgi:hypothetical protein